MLMRNIAEDQRQRNDDLVSSMGARLEYYGAARDEASYFENSFNIREMRNDYLETGNSGSVLELNDSLNVFVNHIKSNQYSRILDWDEQREQLNKFYSKELSAAFDSLTYYQLLFTTLKKEYALHQFNAKMMSH